MVIDKIMTKIIQAVPSWEMTKYYGRVCIFQFQCLKYRIKTSEAWYNFQCRFMPSSLEKEIECMEPQAKKLKNMTNKVACSKNSGTKDIECYSCENEQSTKKKWYQKLPFIKRTKKEEFKDEVYSKQSTHKKTLHQENQYSVNESKKSRTCSKVTEKTGNSNGEQRKQMDSRKKKK